MRYAMSSSNLGLWAPEENRHNDRYHDDRNYDRRRDSRSLSRDRERYSRRRSRSPEYERHRRDKRDERSRSRSRSYDRYRRRDRSRSYDDERRYRRRRSPSYDRYERSRRYDDDRDYDRRRRYEDDRGRRRDGERERSYDRERSYRRRSRSRDGDNRSGRGRSPDVDKKIETTPDRRARSASPSPIHRDTTPGGDMFANEWPVPAELGGPPAPLPPSRQQPPAPDSDSGDEFGPMPLKDPGLKVDVSGMFRGEAEGMARYVADGKRIPRRGEVHSAEEIARLERAGYVMTGDRHKRMNAVRERKEKAVYTAEEARQAALANQELRIARENEAMAHLRELLNKSSEKLFEKGVLHR